MNKIIQISPLTLSVIICENKSVESINENEKVSNVFLVMFAYCHVDRR